MNTPLVRLRMTAYHSVVASPVPLMRNQGRAGSAPSDGAMPASTSCLRVAT